MSKKAKFLLISSCLTLLIIAYIAFTSESGIIKLDKKVVEEIQPAILIEQLKIEYKEKANKIIVSYLDLLDHEKLEINNLNEIKARLLELKLPEDFKELHVNLVLAFDKMENYLLNENTEDELKSQQLIDELIADYSWIDTRAE